MKQLLVFLLLLCSTSVFAQDVIVKKDGSTIVCRVVELTDSEITYKKWSNLNGSNYVMNRADASAINYENGKKVNLSEATNLYMPNNQNDGTQQFNDRALLMMDYNANKGSGKAKKLRTIGWIGGPVLIGAGLLLSTVSKGDGTGGTYNYSLEDPTVIGLMAGGVIWTSGFLIAAYIVDKKEKAQMLQVSSIIKYDVKFHNGSSLSAGIDMLSNRSIGNKTLGFGLCYNF